MSVFVHLSLSIHYNSILTEEHFPSMVYRPKSNLKHHFGASTEVKVNLNKVIHWYRTDWYFTTYNIDFLNVIVTIADSELATSVCN